MERIMSWRSVLEKRPDYVNAIGMITIENANLEIFISELLAAVLTIPTDIGQAIYLTPKAAIARLEILERICSILFNPNRNKPTTEELQKIKENDGRRIMALIPRCRAAIGKRHTIIHDAWGLSELGFEVSRQSLPMKSTFETGIPVEISVLTNLIRDFRQLIDEIDALTMELVVRHDGKMQPPYKMP
jgi:hypothetical protein